MIVVDASAVLAIYFEEPESESFRKALAGRGGVMSAVNLWEVLARSHAVHGIGGVQRAERLLEALDVQLADASVADARRACEAFARFGRSSGGPLNLGDCFAYALAEIEGDGLLFKGDDFPKTDVKSALT